MDLVANLVAIGFTEYEAKVYLQLLRSSPANGYQISKDSGVPRSMVYDALGRLHNRGAVLETFEDKATLYRPLPPEDLLNNHAQQQEQLITVLNEGLGQIYAASDEEYLWSINGRVPVLSYAGHMIREAQTKLTFVLADAELEALKPAIEQASRRGISVSTLLTGEAEFDVGQVVRHPPLESELQRLTSTSMIIADDREVLIATTNQDTTATITRNRSLVSIASQFVWMELFTHRVYAQLGDDLLARLQPEDRQIFESLNSVNRHSKE